jgi:class 3 adenylate cyclase
VTFFSKLGIQSKLLALVLGVSLISITLTGLLSYVSARQSMVEAANQQLLSLRNARAEAITRYFEGVRAQTLTMSYQKMVVDAINSFKPAVEKLESSQLSPEQLNTLKGYYSNEFLTKLKKNTGGNPKLSTYLPPTPAPKYLKYWYTAQNPNPPERRSRLDNAGDGSDYSRIHESFNPRFRVIADEFKYPDIFLIDIDSGVVVYSVAKEVDFATNLRKGPFSDSALAKAWDMARKSRDPEFVDIVDFEQYKPSYGKPSAFMTTTVFDGDKFVGALVIQVSSEKIDAIMNADRKWQEVGLGKTGESFLVGQDNLLRSATRFFLEDKSAYLKTLKDQRVKDDTLALIKTADTPILIQRAATAAIQRALAGWSGLISYTDYRGVPVLGAYQPIKFGNFDWALIAKMDQAEIFKGVNDLSRLLLIATAILIPLITLFSIRMSRSFLRPIRRLIAGTEEIAAGKSGVQVEVRSDDEFGELTTSFNRMASSLDEKEGEIQKHVSQNDRLLATILPPMAAARLKSGQEDTADIFPNVTVLYADVEGFDALAAQLSSERAFVVLNELIDAFDEAAEGFGVEKMRTMGSTYLAICGLSVPRVDHAKRTVDFALAMLKIIRRFSQSQTLDLSLDIGIHSGPVSAGVVGKTKFNYEIWGNTINIAKQIHQSPKQNVIQATGSLYESLNGLYRFEKVKVVEADEIGSLTIWEVTPLEETATNGAPLAEVG